MGQFLLRVVIVRLANRNDVRQTHTYQFLEKSQAPRARTDETENRALATGSFSACLFRVVIVAGRG